MKKNIIGVCIRTGRKYCWVMISNTPYEIINKFRISPHIKFKRKEVIGKLAFLTKQGYANFI